MTLHKDGALAGADFSIVDGKYVCLATGEEFETREQFIAHAESMGPAEPEEEQQDPTALPPGYTTKKGRGSYYSLYDPDGELVEGPSNKKWQGEDGAAQGAWAHFKENGGDASA